MMTIPRGLSEEEAAAWAKLAQSVTPFEGRTAPKATEHSGEKPKLLLSKKPAKLMSQPPRRTLDATPKLNAHPAAPVKQTGLDGSWEKKLRGGNLAPDFTLDLHGHNLDSAHHRLETGIAQAVAMDARIVLLIAGKSRPVDPADRGQRRGAIRAKVLDWLAAGPHASNIAAIRKAHRRHGGEGALYLVLKRRR